MQTKIYLLGWIQRRAGGLAARTVESYSDEIQRHFIPAFGETELSQLTADQISAMLADIISTGHTRAAENAYTVLNKALGDAVRDKLLPFSPMMAVERPKHHSKGFRWMESDELSAYLEVALADRNRLAWLLALCCGLRRGELCGLRWEDVDLSHKVLHVRNQRQQIRRKGCLDLPPKSEAGFRSIPIPDDVLSLLFLDWHSEGYILIGAKGKPYTPSGLYQAHRAMIEAAHLPSVSPHGLRVTFGSQAVSNGVHVRVMQLLFGHASYLTTAKFYSAVDTASRVTAIDKIADSLVKLYSESSH